MERSVEMSRVVFVVIFAMIACALLGVAIGDTKGRSTIGFWLGVLLGPIGVVIVALTSPTPEAQAKYERNVALAANTLDGAQPLRTCPWCAEQIQSAARLCRYCGRDVDPIRRSDNPQVPPSE